MIDHESEQNRVVVIGSRTREFGVALTYARDGYDVALCDANGDALRAVGAYTTEKVLHSVDVPVLCPFRE